jgi:thioredoxin-related protein
MDQVSTIKNVDGKYFFVDLYTDWCGWCKRMDKTTFVDPAVVKLMDDKFHSVKFDAEQKEPINFNGKTYNWQPGGRKGVNQLAVELLNGRLSYPSFVVLDKNLNVKKTIIGYKKPEQLLSELQNL